MVHRHLEFVNAQKHLLSTPLANIYRSLAQKRGKIVPISYVQKPLKVNKLLIWAHSLGYDGCAQHPNEGPDIAARAQPLQNSQETIAGTRDIIRVLRTVGEPG
jgi:hypothetical protein